MRNNSKGNSKVKSAARSDPLPETKRKLTKQALREGALDTALNTASILRDVVGDFRRSDRFFKYKALVIVCWGLLSTTSFAVACGRGGGPSNDVDARLVVAGDVQSPVYMVKNEGTAEWTDVEVTVNGTYRSTAAQISGYREITLSPIVLFDSDGQVAPKDLQIRDIELRVGEKEHIVLLKNGEVR